MLVGRSHYLQRHRWPRSQHLNLWPRALHQQYYQILWVKVMSLRTHWPQVPRGLLYLQHLWPTWVTTVLRLMAKVPRHLLYMQNISHMTVAAVSGTQPTWHHLTTVGQLCVVRLVVQRHHMATPPVSINMTSSRAPLYFEARHGLGRNSNGCGLLSLYI